MLKCLKWDEKRLVYALIWFRTLSSVGLLSKSQVICLNHWFISFLVIYWKVKVCVWSKTPITRDALQTLLFFPSSYLSQLYHWSVCVYDSLFGHSWSLYWQSCHNNKTSGPFTQISMEWTPGVIKAPTLMCCSFTEKLFGVIIWCVYNVGNKRLKLPGVWNDLVAR